MKNKKTLSPQHLIVLHYTEETYMCILHHYTYTNGNTPNSLEYILKC